ncbi:ankyrin-3-like [Phalaenopsis equestris]|uniref:ankyrin-3-like n=1 Tax=Phalaenopsis equestris TaxID=78828 RepID=UPI0009E5C1A4|nr:ankyrin-3-like [Phalaenopsis equestris]
MDRLIKIEPTNEVAIRVETGQRCSGMLTLRNVMYTMPVAFRLLPLNRNRFSIRPQTGIIAPLATLTVEITYLPPLAPAPFVPDSAPESDDTFFLDSVVSPGAVFKDGVSATALDAVPADWFTAKKKQVFSDSALRVYYVGSAVLARLVDSGEMEKVREVLERSDPAWGSANSSDTNGQSLLHLAIASSRADLVQLILEFGADVEARSRTGQSPLETAAAAGETLIAELLLARGASTERSIGSPMGPIHLAAAGGHTELLRLLLLKGAAPDAATADGRTSLHLAAALQRRECAELLLSAGTRADVLGGPANETPLHLAAAAGDEATTRLLISSGCAGLREARNGAGKTAFDVAAEEGQRRLFDLLKAGEGLATAARSGDVRAVVRAIEMGAAVDGKDGFGWTALMRAGFKGRVEIMKVLIEKGASLDARDEAGYTALHCAAEAGQVEAVEVLVKRGADVELKTGKGKTALEIATTLGYTGIVRILVNGGAVAGLSIAICNVSGYGQQETLPKGTILGAFVESYSVRPGWLVTAVSNSSRISKLNFDDIMGLMLNEEVRRKAANCETSGSVMNDDNRKRNLGKNTGRGRSKSKTGKPMSSRGEC